uniref:Uncharacterized protein n=1 Tax=Anguilla anguilla TaxID=7936 RepID=A0A0E9W2U3_ANGAN
MSLDSRWVSCKNTIEALSCLSLCITCFNLVILPNPRTFHDMYVIWVSLVIYNH